MLQDDILGIYNSLTIFSKETVTSKLPRPISVKADPETGVLAFEQKGQAVYVGQPQWYSFDLPSLGLSKVPAWLWPEDYNYLMSTLLALIEDPNLLIRDRVLISPQKYGFDVLRVNEQNLSKGPELRGQVRFISGKGKLFNWYTKRKFRDVL